VSSLAGYWCSAQSHLYIHAPFAFQLVKDVIYDEQPHAEYNNLLSLRHAQLNDRSPLSFAPAGALANGHMIENNVAQIARRYALPVKHAKLLLRLVKFLKPRTILETGTGTGFSAAALALGNSNAAVYTVDAVQQLSDLARRHHRDAGIANVRYAVGDLDAALVDMAKKITPIDFVYLDANHTREATLRYFEGLLPHLSPNACIAVDDIHWSSGMKKAWLELTRRDSVSLSIDLFRLGLLFFNPGLNREALRVYF